MEKYTSDFLHSFCVYMSAVLVSPSLCVCVRAVKLATCHATETYRRYGVGWRVTYNLCTYMIPNTVKLVTVVFKERKKLVKDIDWEEILFCLMFVEYPMEESVVFCNRSARKCGHS